MPAVHDGIGTWYYGKRRIHSRKGTCEFCGSVAELRSYDTTLFFVVLMVPLFPLGRRRILEECSVCRKHRVLPLKEWEEAKVTQGAVVLDKLQQNPDRDAILQALDFAQGYQDEPLFDQLVAPVAKEFSRDAAVQARLADGYAYFAHWAEAERAYRAALAVEDTEPVRERLAWALLKQERPLEARPYLQHALDKKLGDAAGLIYYLILGYQAEGMHDEALALMDQRDQAFPQFIGLKEYQQQRRTSTRHQGSQKRVRSALLQERQPGFRTGNWTAQLPRWSGALLVLGLVAAYFISAIWIGQERKVFLVNGTSKEYAVSVNGQEHRLRPGATPVRIAEGNVEVAFTEPKQGLEPIRCQIETSFWTRPFAGYTFVINPDRIGSVFEEETFYAKNPAPNPPIKLHVGKEFYSLPGVDYEFQPFPPTLQVQGGQSVRKTRIALLPVMNNQMRLDIIMHQVPRQDQVEVTKRLLHLDPGNSLMLSWLASLLPAETMLGFLQTRLDDRPVRVDWHRFYQNLTDKTQPGFDLTPRYEKLVAETAGNADALYLLGRSLEDFDKGEELIQKAANATPPSGYAMFALGYRALGDGRFGEAVAWLDKGLPLVKDSSFLRQTLNDALLAKKDYDRLLQEFNMEATQPGNQIVTLVQIARIHAIRGNKLEARQTLQRLPVQGAERAVMQPALDVIVSCAEADLAGFLKASEANQGPPTFEAQLLRGKLEEAGALATTAHRDADIYHGLVYLAATRAGAKELAATHWKALQANLAKGAREERRLEEVLAGRKTLAQELIDQMIFEPRRKRVFLAVLAQRYPEQAKGALELARTLDFQRDALSLCLRQVLDKKNAGVAPH